MLGVTARGAFLAFDQGQVVFLSKERFPGPLSLSCPDADWGLEEVRPGAEIRVRLNALEIPSARLQISWEGATPWAAPLPPGDVLPFAQRIQRIRDLASLLLERRRQPGNSPLLAGLLDLLNVRAAAESRLPGNLSAVCGALAERNGGLLAAALDPFLGWGPGLTPSGDDLAAGSFLAISRWGKHLFPGWKFKDAGAALVLAAQRKTTTLSAAIIACSMHGQADERLVLALDGTLTGNLELERCAALLSSWGNTSGGDALVGMGLAVLGERTQPGEL